MNEIDHAVTLITSLTALVAAIAGLVTALGAIILSWRQQRQIDANTVHVAEHIAICPSKTNQSIVP
jgi:hypothetical protein